MIILEGVVYKMASGWIKHLNSNIPSTFTANSKFTDLTGLHNLETNFPTAVQNAKNAEGNGGTGSGGATAVSTATTPTMATSNTGVNTSETTNTRKKKNSLVLSRSGGTSGSGLNV